MVFLINIKPRLCQCIYIYKSNIYLLLYTNNKNLYTCMNWGKFSITPVNDYFQTASNLLQNRLNNKVENQQCYHCINMAKYTTVYKWDKDFIFALN